MYNFKSIFQIYYCSSRWPGSVHDSRILRNSSLAEYFDIEDNLPFPGGIILGDSGYGLSEWLITPIAVPIMDEEEKFNMHHKKMRRLIECCNGVLKQRFRCLNYLHMDPTFAGNIMKACCVLHNMMIESRSEIFDIDDIEIIEDVVSLSADGHETSRRRDELIQHFVNIV